MKLIKQFFLSLPILFLIHEASAAETKFTIEPLYGVETALVRYPEPARYVNRATYGGRVLYGITLFSGELEYTEAHSSKSYPGEDMKVVDKSQRLSAGIRSTFPMGNYFGIYVRAGGRASQGETKITEADETKTVKNPLQVDPYAGAGLQLAFSSNMALNAGVTLIRNGEDHYDSQYTLGLTARFGKL